MGVKVCKAGEHLTAEKKCTKCATGHTCNGCKQVLKAVTCPAAHTFTVECAPCPAGYKCDGTSAASAPTTPKPTTKAAKKPAVTTNPTMSDAKAWSTALPLLITAFAAIVV